MRLICPNCDAQYEVDASLVPPTGRDVQCSNCGKTWFQEPRDTLKLTPEQEAAEPEPPEAETPEFVSEDEVSRDGLSGDGLSQEAEDFFSGGNEPEFGEYDGDAAASASAASSDAEFDMNRDLIDENGDGLAAQLVSRPDAEQFVQTDGYEDGDVEAERPEIDPAIMGILKSEADREMAARRADAEQIETQPDLGVGEPDPRDSVSDRTARLRGFEDEHDDLNDQEPRRALLPDIDEINSTLTATDDRTADGDAVAAVKSQVVESVQKRRVGFRLGFSVMLIIAATLILVYLYAPQIAEAIPSAEPQLAGYVDWANGVRQTLDGYLEESVNRLTTLLVELTT